MTAAPLTDEQKAAVYAARVADPATSATVERWKAGTDLVEPARHLPEVQRWQQMIEMARYLSRSALMPAHIRDSRDPEADAVVVLLAAHDLGLNATTAFQDMHVVKGKLGMSAKLMRALVRRDGHLLDVEVQPGEQGAPFAARAYGRRADDPPEYVREATFTLEDARVAQLIEAIGEDGVPRVKGEKTVWRHYTADMLVARATSRWARYNAEESLGGMSYTPEELGEIVEVENLAQQQPPRSAADEGVRDGLRERILALPIDAQQRVREEWKRTGLGPLNPSPNNGKVLTVTQVAVADVLIRHEEEQQPADAEIVDESSGHPFEGSESATVCATCGEARASAVHVPSEAPEATVTGKDVPSAPARPTETVELPPVDTDAPTARPEEGLVGFPPPNEWVNALDDVMVLVELAAFRVEVPRTKSARRNALTATYAERVIHEECGKVAMGPRRDGEPFCECPV